LIRAILAFVEHRHRNCHLTETLAPLTERATRGELAALLTAWLQQRQRQGVHWRAPRDTIVQVIVGGIFGAATQWSSQETTTISADQKAADILQVLADGLGGLIPGALSDG